MSNQEINKLEEELGDLRKAKEEVKKSFSHIPSIQSKILSNLNGREKLLLEFIKEKHKEVSLTYEQSCGLLCYCFT